MTAINISNITYKLKAKMILDQISISVEEGEAFALLGENGSGKSTLIDIILSDVKSNEGSISILNNGNKCFNNVGVVYDHLPLFPMLKVHEILKYFSAIQNKSYQTIESNYFEYFEIDKIKNSFIKQLSQGEKKRVGILIALIAEPDIMILDEPFANLDPTITKRLWKLIRGKNRTIFFTTHNWKEVENFATKICFIHNGKIISKAASPKETLKQIKGNKKVTFEFNKEMLKHLDGLNYYKYENELNVFFNHPNNILQFISKHTNNFSIQNADLKDAYLLKTNNN